MKGEWRRAFARQARSDLAVFERLLADTSIPVCHALHYLQMAAEKTAKAGILSPGAVDPPETIHGVVLRAIRMARHNPQLRDSFRNMRDHRRWERYLASLLPYAGEIEALAPTSARLHAPNPEYPWIEGAAVRAPCLHGFEAVHPASNPKAGKLVEFLKSWLDSIERNG